MSDHDSLRNALKSLNQESTAQLRILYARATGRRGDGVSRDVLIKNLASRTTVLALDERVAEAAAVIQPRQARAAQAFGGAQVFATEGGNGRARRSRRV